MILHKRYHAMKELTFEGLSQLIAERKRQYANADDAVSAYNRENELSREYNGRQILELIQNADDAGARQVRIGVDSEAGVFSFYNDGEPFSFDGIKSIMIANLSSKVSSSYIGNKGLGFRSILTWADEVSIFSSNLKITFSAAIALKVMRELGLDIGRIRRERMLSATCVPFPVLGIPEVTVTDTAIVGCRVEIRFKEDYINDIYRQISNIDGKTLLFLNHIETIGTDNAQMSVRKRDGRVSSSDGREWLIRAAEAELPDEYQDSNRQEKKKYAVKIAIPCDGEHCDEASLLYNYLPTKELVALPYIIHATLELDSSRNRINESRVNDYILGRVADVITDYATELLADTGRCGWAAYAAMTPAGHSASTLIETCLYAELRRRRDAMAIFPTIGGRYVDCGSYYFAGNADSSFWQNFGIFADGTDKILLPLPEVLNDRPVERRIEPSVWTTALNAMSRRGDLTLERRAGLINYLVRSGCCRECAGKIELLTDRAGRVIGGQHKTFTPPQGDAEYPLPRHVALSFMNNALYDRLMLLFQADGLIDLYYDSGGNKSRALSALLSRSGVAAVSSYDKDEVLRAIVSQTNSGLAKPGADAQALIRSMVTSLYAIYVSMGFEKVLDAVRLVDWEGDVRDASELLVGSRLNLQVFGPAAGYVADAAFWGINADESTFFKFMKLLGVNRLTVIQLLGEDDKRWGYYGFIEQNKEFKYDQTHNCRSLNNGSSGLSVRRMSLLLQSVAGSMTLDRIVLLLCEDEELQSATKEKSFLRFSYQKREIPFETEYTYLRYQFLNLPVVRNSILAGDVVIAPGFDRAALDDIPKETVSRTLEYLATNLRGTSDCEVEKMLDDLVGRNYDYRGIRKVYKIVIEALSADNRSLQGNFRLCATDYAGNVGYYPAAEVFYSDNTCIPRRLIERLNLHRLYYGARQGTEKVCRVLGLRRFQDVGQEVADVTYSVLDAQFQRYFDKAKPYFLLYSLQNVDRNRKEVAGRLRNCKVRLVAACTYTVPAISFKGELQAKEFIKCGDTYYVGTGDVDSVDELRRSVEYCNAIAEIIAIALRLEGRNDKYIHIFRDFSFMEQVAAEEFSIEEIDECHELLGVSPAEAAFWTKVSELAGINMPGHDKDAMRKEAIKLMQVNDFDFDKVDFAGWNSRESVRLLELLPEEVRIGILKGIDLSVWHKRMFETVKKDCKASFETALWNSLNSRGAQAQSGYIGMLNEYDRLPANGLDCHRLLRYDDYKKLLQEAVSANFGVELVDSPHEICNLYPDIVPDENELPTAEARSLLYFAGNEAAVKEALSEAAQPEAVGEDDLQPSDYELSIVTAAGIEAGKIVHKSGHVGSPAVHSKKADTRREQAGRRAERAVKLMLEAGGIECRWRSGYSDSPDKDDTLGYDFEYKPADGGEWRLLEVKSAAGGKFVISWNEYRVARENLDRYDVALVEGNKITIVQNFFGQSGNYAIEANEYTVSFKPKRSLGHK